jgi:hypothetical protein
VQRVGALEARTTGRWHRFRLPGVPVPTFVSCRRACVLRDDAGGAVVGFNR